jgi:Arm DNA-binding domain/Phage integrase, N-terminal SAM-like domain
MRGSVVKRGDGYTVVVELDRDPITNKRRQKWHSGYRTKREAERALSDLVASVHSGGYVEPTKQNLAQFASEWLAAIKPTVRPATHYSYERNLRLHVLLPLGRCRCAASMQACSTRCMRRCWPMAGKTTLGAGCRLVRCATSTRSFTGHSRMR